MIFDSPLSSGRGRVSPVLPMTSDEGNGGSDDWSSLILSPPALRGHAAPLTPSADPCPPLCLSLPPPRPAGCGSCLVYMPVDVGEFGPFAGGCVYVCVLEAKSVCEYGNGEMGRRRYVPRHGCCKILSIE